MTDLSTDAWAGEVNDLARIIWHHTYRHDTLLDWHEIKPGTMHHKRVMTAAEAVRAILDEESRHEP